MDERRRMWWEAATAGVNGCVNMAARQIKSGDLTPDDAPRKVAHTSGLVADALLAEHDRRFPAGEGEVKWYSSGSDESGQCFKVCNGEVWFLRNGREPVRYDDDEAETLERDVADGVRRRLTPAQAAALLAPKQAATPADTPTLRVAAEQVLHVWSDEGELTEDEFEAIKALRTALATPAPHAGVPEELRDILVRWRTVRNRPGVHEREEREIRVDIDEYLDAHPEVFTPQPAKGEVQRA